VKRKSRLIHDRQRRRGNFTDFTGREDSERFSVNARDAVTNTEHKLGTRGVVDPVSCLIDTVMG